MKAKTLRPLSAKMTEHLIAYKVVIETLGFAGEPKFVNFVTVHRKRLAFIPPVESGQFKHNGDNGYRLRFAICGVSPLNIACASLNLIRCVAVQSPTEDRLWLALFCHKL